MEKFFFCGDLFSSFRVVTRLCCSRAPESPARCRRFPCGDGRGSFISHVKGKTSQHFDPLLLSIFGARTTPRAEKAPSLQHPIACSVFALALYVDMGTPLFLMQFVDGQEEPTEASQPIGMKIHGPRNSELLPSNRCSGGIIVPSKDFSCG